MKIIGLFSYHHGNSYYVISDLIVVGADTPGELARTPAGLILGIGAAIGLGVDVVAAPELAGVPLLLTAGPVGAVVGVAEVLTGGEPADVGETVTDPEVLGVVTLETGRPGPKTSVLVVSTLSGDTKFDFPSVSDIMIKQLELMINPIYSCLLYTSPSPRD